MKSRMDSKSKMSGVIHGEVPGGSRMTTTTTTTAGGATTTTTTTTTPAPGGNASVGANVQLQPAVVKLTPEAFEKLRRRHFPADSEQQPTQTIDSITFVRCFLSPAAYKDSFEPAIEDVKHEYLRSGWDTKTWSFRLRVGVLMLQSVVADMLNRATRILRVLSGISS